MKLRNLTHQTVTHHRLSVYGHSRDTYEREEPRPWWDAVCNAVYLAGIAAMIAAPFVALVLLANWGSATSCHHKADAMQVEHRWGFFAGCIVRADDTQPWFPLDQYRTEVDQ